MNKKFKTQNGLSIHVAGIGNLKHKNYLSQLIILAMIFCLNSMSLKAQWQASSGAGIDKNVNIGGAAVSRTNCDSRKVQYFQDGYDYLRAIVSEGNNGGIYWETGGGSGTLSYYNANLMAGASYVVSPDVAIIYINGSTTCAPHLSVVYYYNESGHENTYFEDYIWNGSAFVYNSSGSTVVTNLVNILYGSAVINKKVRNCIHVDADFVGNFVIVWDDPELDTAISPQDTGIKFVIGYVDCSNTKLVYHDVNYIRGSNIQWPDVSLYNYSSSNTSRTTPSDTVFFVYENDDLNKILYKYFDLTPLITGYHSINVLTAENVVTGYRFKNPRISCNSLWYNFENAVACIVSESDKNNSPFKHRMFVRLIDAHGNISNSKELNQYESNDLWQSDSYSPCVTFAYNYDNFDRYFIAGMTTEDASNMPSSQPTCIVGIYSYTSSLVLSKANNMNGWAVPYNYSGSKYSQTALSLAGQYEAGRNMYTFYDPNSYTGIGDDVWFKFQTVSNALAHNALRLVSDESNSPVRIYPTLVTTGDRISVETDCTTPDWNLQIATTDGKLLYDGNVKCTGLEDIINLRIARGITLVTLSDAISQQKLYFKIANLQ